MYYEFLSVWKPGVRELDAREPGAWKPGAPEAAAQDTASLEHFLKKYDAHSRTSFVRPSNREAMCTL